MNHSTGTEDQANTQWGQITADFYLANCINASRQTAQRNQRIVEKFLRSVRVNTVQEITAHDVQNYLIDQKTVGMADKTLRNYHGAICRFLDYCIRSGLAKENVAKGIPLPKLEERVPIFLSESEIALALKVAREYDLYVEVALAIHTGLRMTELRRLMWTDIDPRQKTLLVRQSKSRRPRRVPLCRVAREALAEQRKRYGHLTYVFPGGRAFRRGGWCVPRPRGREWWVAIALKPIQAAVPKFCSLPKGSTGRGWHLLRHTFGSILAQQGVSIYKISTWMGHKSVDTTRIYAHLASGYDEDIE